MESLKYLPEVSERIRGGVASLGYDRVIQIREEFSLLENVVAAVLGIPQPSLTKARIVEFVGMRDAKLAAVQFLSAEEAAAQAEAVADTVPALLDAPDRPALLREVVSSAIAFASR